MGNDYFIYVCDCVRDLSPSHVAGSRETKFIASTHVSPHLGSAGLCCLQEDQHALLEWENGSRNFTPESIWVSTFAKHISSVYLEESCLELQIEEHSGARASLVVLGLQQWQKAPHALLWVREEGEETRASKQEDGTWGRCSSDEKQRKKAELGAPQSYLHFNEQDQYQLGVWSLVLRLLE